MMVEQAMYGMIWQTTRLDGSNVDVHVPGSDVMFKVTVAATRQG